MTLHLCDNGFYGIKFLPKRGSLKTEIDETHLKKLLSEFGEVKLFQLPNNNLAFAFFQEHDEARSCLDSMRSNKDYIASPGWPKQTTMGENKFKKTPMSETSNVPNGSRDNNDNLNKNTEVKEMSKREQPQNFKEEKTFEKRKENVINKGRPYKYDTRDDMKAKANNFDRNKKKNPLTSKLIEILTEVNAANLEKERNDANRLNSGEISVIRSQTEIKKPLRSRSETRRDNSGDQSLEKNCYKAKNRFQSEDRIGLNRRNDQTCDRTSARDRHNSKYIKAEEKVQSRGNETKDSISKAARKQLRGRSETRKNHDENYMKSGSRLQMDDRIRLNHREELRNYLHDFTKREQEVQSRYMMDSGTRRNVKETDVKTPHRTVTGMAEETGRGGTSSKRPVECSLITAKDRRISKSTSGVELCVKREASYVVLLNLPVDITAGMIYDLCKAFASDVLDIDLKYPSRSYLPLYAYVFTKTKEDAKKLQKCIDGKYWKQNKIHAKINEDFLK